MKWMFRLWYEFKFNTLTRESFQKAMLPIKKNIEALLLEGTKSAFKKTRGTCLQLLKHKESLWTFVYHDKVDPTNNFAERSLRAYVLWRKRSFGSQSQRGNQYIERMMTVRTTCQLQKRNTKNFLIASLEAHYGKGKAPSLIPKKERTQYSNAS